MDNYTGSTSTGMGSSKSQKGSSRTGSHHRSGVRSRNEDEATSKIEQTTAKVPSIAFLSMAMGAMAGSLGLFLAGRREAALFVATWVPTVLILGNYNKIVKAIEDIDTGGLGGEFQGGGSSAF